MPFSKKAWKGEEGKKMHRKATVPLDGSKLAESVLPYPDGKPAAPSK
jgi:hypothetical protein